MFKNVAWAKIRGLWISGVKFMRRSVIITGYALRAALSGVETLARRDGPSLDSDFAPLGGFLARRGGWPCAERR